MRFGLGISTNIVHLPSIETTRPEESPMELLAPLLATIPTIFLAWALWYVERH